jgi:hypothetical protein
VRSRVARLVLAIGFAALACRPPGGDGEDTGDGEADTGTTGDLDSVPAPAFLNPALGDFTIVSTQYVPKDIVVQRITLGNTQLLIDGQAAGTLGPGSSLGELTGDRLRIFLHGALTLGTHTLQLASHAADGPRFSTELTMNVTAPTTRPPQVRAEIEPEPRDVGDALILSGSGSDALLGVLTAGPTPELRLYRVVDGAWPAAPLAETALPGYTPKAMSFTPGVTARALPPTPGNEAYALRLAYSRGVPGDAILTRDLTVDSEPSFGPLQTAVDLSADLFRDAEFAALGRPFLLGDALLAEFLAADDAETAHPGDRGLVHVRRTSDRTAWSVPERVPTPDPIDLDAIGPALSLPQLTLGGALSVRMGQRLAGLLTLSDAGAALISVPDDNFDLLPGAPALLTTITSNLGARTVAAIGPDRKLAVAFLGTGGRPRNSGQVLGADDLPAASVTAPPAAGVVLGYSAFLVPYGDAAPVHVVLGDGSSVFVAELVDPEPLHCRAVALLPSLAGNTDEPALPLACLQADGLRVGHLTTERPD